MLNYRLIILWFVKNYRNIRRTLARKSMFKSRSKKEERGKKKKKKITLTKKKISTGALQMSNSVILFVSDE